MSNATIKDVARVAGVSLKTVSRVINNEPAVRDRTRDKVRVAIKALNYSPDVSARNLRGTKSYAIGLVYDNPNSYYVIDIQNGVLASCRELGYGLQIHPCDSTRASIGQELVDLARQSRLAGLVLAPPISEDAAIVDILRRHDIHVVRIVSGVREAQTDGPCVFVNDRQAAYDITEHLIAEGHERIGFLWGDTHHKSSPERYEGYAAALADHDIARDKALVIPGDYSFDSGMRGTKQLLDLDAPPSAVFGSNDEIAAGALVAATARGLRVPEDLAIAGFEDSPFSRQSLPQLTTARQSTEAIARFATRHLIADLRPHAVDNAEELEAANEFVPELIIRGSTRA